MVHIPKSSGINKRLSQKGFKGIIGKVFTPAIGPKTMVKNPCAMINKPIKVYNGSPIIKEIKPMNVTKDPFMPQCSRVSNIPNNLKKNVQIPIKKTVPPQHVIKKSIPQIPANKYLTKLPPGISVTRTTGVTGQVRNKRKAEEIQTGVTIKKACKNKVLPYKNPLIGEVLTVELDDDLPKSSAERPQWYLKPENQNTMEEKNNQEPDSSKFIEIVIEDSPVKPVNSKKLCEIEHNSVITISDSPAKSLSEKNIVDKSSNGSEETKNEIVKTPTSKKKLQYPIEGSVKLDEDVVEKVENLVEQEKKVIDETKDVIAKQTCKSSRDISPKNITKVIAENKILETQSIIFDVEDSPVKIPNDQSDQPSTSGLTKDRSQVIENNKEKCVEIEKKDNLKKGSIEVIGEFHPVYQNFIDLCFKLENSDDMKRIVEKKIKTYYRQVPKIYTESEEFIEMVSSKMGAMSASPDKMYLYIKDIVDELNLQRKMYRSQCASTSKPPSVG